MGERVGLGWVLGVGCSVLGEVGGGEGRREEGGGGGADD